MPTIPSTRPSTQSQATAATSPLGPTSPVQRRKGIDKLVKNLAKDAKEGTAASGYLLAANAKTQQWAFSYGTGSHKEMNVVTGPANNKLQLTAAFHISGHTDEADKFARDPNESFTFTVTGPDLQSRSEVVKMGGGPGKPVYAKAHDIEFDISKPGKYVVTISPTMTSAGGYTEGRTYNVNVGAENFYKPTKPPAGFKEREGQSYPYPYNEIASLVHFMR